MKNKLVLLGIVAGIVAPLSAQADPESFRSGDTTGQLKAKTHQKAAATKAQPARQVVYITNQSATGSHLPLVVGRYNGHYDSMSPTSVYGRPDLDRTGQLNVQGELAQRDPAISSAGNGMRR